MFKIIGGDGKQYGPVTGDEVRAWIAGGRANGQTMVQREGETDWKPLSQFPEFAETLGAGATEPPPGSTVPPPATPDNVTSADSIAEAALARRAEVDVSHCLGRAWDLLKEDFWPIIGISALILIITGVAHGLLSGPLVGGLLWYYLRRIRRQAASINDAFAGFSGFTAPFLQLFLGALVSGLLGAIGLMFCILPGIYLVVAWQLTLPLIQDRHLDFWEAMEVSRKVVTREWWNVFLFTVCVFGLNLVGALCCGIGIFITWPWTMIALAYLYEDLFGTESSPRQLPAGT